MNPNVGDQQDLNSIIVIWRDKAQSREKWKPYKVLIDGNHIGRLMDAGLVTASVSRGIQHQIEIFRGDEQIIDDCIKPQLNRVELVCDNYRPGQGIGNISEVSSDIPRPTYLINIASLKPSGRASSTYSKVRALMATSFFLLVSIASLGLGLFLIFGLGSKSSPFSILLGCLVLTVWLAMFRVFATGLHYLHAQWKYPGDLMD
jgi:hypothetical protein